MRKIRFRRKLTGTEGPDFEAADEAGKAMPAGIIAGGYWNDHYFRPFSAKN
jgi:hypothetical protein